MPTADFMEKQREREELIQRAVEAAHAVIDDGTERTDDETAYLTYKVGGSLLANALERLDKRLFIQDLTSSGIAKVKIQTQTCKCGRLLRGADLLCEGCNQLAELCNCKTLSATTRIK